MFKPAHVCAVKQKQRIAFLSMRCTDDGRWVTINSTKADTDQQAHNLNTCVERMRDTISRVRESYHYKYRKSGGRKNVR